MSSEKTTYHDDQQQDKDSGTQPQEKKAGFKDFVRIFRYADSLDRALFGVALVSAILSGASLPLTALFFGGSATGFSNYASGQDDAESFKGQINSSVLNFVYLFIGRFIVGYIGSLSICVAAARTTNALRKAFLTSLLRKEIAHFDRASGAVASQVTTNGARINTGIAEKLYNFVNGISLFLSSFVVALAVQPVLAIIIMSIVPGILVTIGASITTMIPIEAKISDIYSSAATIAQDALGSIKTIFALGSESKILRWYEEKLQQAHQEGRKKSLILGPLFSAQYFFTLCGTALGFWQGFRMYQSGQINDVGKVLTVILSVTLGASSLTSLMGSIENIATATSAASELFGIMDHDSLLDPLSREGKQPSACTGDIEFKNVSFAYPSRSSVTVLRNLHLSIPAGKTTALVGPSGCGKSTIVSLLERWYQPLSGQILLDGEDLSHLNTKWLRKQIRLVQQEPTLFSGTVYDNVANGFVDEQMVLPKNERMKLVEDACKAADAHDFITQLPHAYQTELGERGGMLSGGQLQRISIARSVVSAPKILLCDEATSALDPRAEKAVQDSLESVSKDKTTLIIAHKLATVKAADNIAVMKDGRVVEQGNHDDLVRQDGLYAAMVRAQDLGDQSRLQKTSSDLDPINDEIPGEESGHLGLQRKRSKEEASRLQDDVDRLNQGTLHYPLLRCIWIMFKENTGLYNWYLLISVAYIMVGGTYPAQAVLFSRMIRVFTLQGDEARKQADFYSLMFFVLAIANLIGYFCIGISVNIIGQKLTHRYRHEMLERVLGFDLDFFDCPENSSGALTARLSSVPAAVQELMSTNLGLLLTVVVNMISTSILGIAYGWKLGLVMVFAGLSVIVGSGFVRIRLDQKLEARTEAQFSKSASLAAEAVGGIRTVSLLTMEESVLEQYGRTLDGIVSEVIRSLVNFLIPTLVPYTFSQSAEFLVLALGFWYGSRLIADGEYNIEQFFTIFIAIVFGGQAAAQLFTYTTSITKATGNANYVLWLRTIKANIREDRDNEDRGPSADEISIEAKAVEFRYKQRRDARVLRGISIDIRPGSYAAFVGPSGCGKSTILSLVERFYDPTSGSMLMNGEGITQYSPRKYREIMSIVQQNPPLYLGSVRENIAIGLDYEPTDEEITVACEQANAREFIASLPEGLNTQCGSRGLQFSGGQRQRIAVARALIRQPKLLLLDEATSALDTQSERLVQDALNQAASGRTTISVAHRLSTIRHADIIFVIEDGKVAEMGTHDELIRQRGRYLAMCLAQSLDQG